MHTQPLIKGGPWHRMRGKMLKVASPLAVDVAGRNPRQVQSNDNRILIGITICPAVLLHIAQLNLQNPMQFLNFKACFSKQVFGFSSYTTIGGTWKSLLGGSPIRGLERAVDGKAKKSLLKSMNSVVFIQSVLSWTCAEHSIHWVSVATRTMLHF